MAPTIQWIPSNSDTDGTEEFVHDSEVSLFKQLFLGKVKVSLLSSFQRFVVEREFHCM